MKHIRILLRGSLILGGGCLAGWLAATFEPAAYAIVGVMFLATAYCIGLLAKEM